ncbi:MAG: nitrate/nitrite transporter NrtS [Sphingomonadales bacterium]|nr:nitrate/nitrite transporter NrtS [Sphingomonadales bacterium]MDE2169307.1 nitrate/nitrite transporter NrtS [Sphingomonadales bacterium]
MARLIHAMLSRPVVINALRIALVVGTCLNLINQGSAIFHGEPVQWGKLLLNFAVPYLVASYSAARVQLGQEP